MVFLLYSINMFDYINFSNIKTTINGNKPHLVKMNDILFIYHWIIHANILLRNFAMIMKDVGL